MRPPTTSGKQPINAAIVRSRKPEGVMEILGMTEIKKEPVREASQNGIINGGAVGCNGDGHPLPASSEYMYARDLMRARDGSNTPIDRVPSKEYLEGLTTARDIVNRRIQQGVFSSSNDKNMGEPAGPTPEYIRGQIDIAECLNKEVQEVMMQQISGREHSNGTRVPAGHSAPALHAAKVPEPIIVMPRISQVRSLSTLDAAGVNHHQHDADAAAVSHETLRKVKSEGNEVEQNSDVAAVLTQKGTEREQDNDVALQKTPREKKPQTASRTQEGDHLTTKTLLNEKGGNTSTSHQRATAGARTTTEGVIEITDDEDDEDSDGDVEMKLLDSNGVGASKPKPFYIFQHGAGVASTGGGSSGYGSKLNQVGRHSRSDHSVRPYQCDQCDKKYSCRSGLRQHKATCHSDVPLKKRMCEFCGHVYKREKSMKEHKVGCHMNPNRRGPYYCTVKGCPKKGFPYSMQKKLNEHLKTRHSCTASPKDQQSFNWA